MQQGKQPKISKLDRNQTKPNPQNMHISNHVLLPPSYSTNSLVSFNMPRQNHEVIPDAFFTLHMMSQALTFLASSLSSQPHVVFSRARIPELL